MKIVREKYSQNIDIANQLSNSSDLLTSLARPQSDLRLKKAALDAKNKIKSLVYKRPNLLLVK